MKLTTKAEAMKYFLSTILILTAFFIIAQPKQIPFQGVLYDNGVPVDSTVELTFTIYETFPTTAIWSETHGSVSVVAGYYSVVLGSVEPSINPIPEELFYDANVREMQIEVGVTDLGVVNLYAPFTGSDQSIVQTGDPLDNGIIVNDTSILMYQDGTGSDNGKLTVDLESDGTLTLYGRDAGNTYLRSAVQAGQTISSGNSYLNLYGENQAGDGPSLMVDLYTIGKDIQFQDFSANYRRGGIDLKDNEGNLLTAVSGNRGAAPGQSGWIFTRGTNTPNVEIGGRSWENNDLPFIQLFGSSSNGAGWFQNNMWISVDTMGTKEWGVLSIQKTDNTDPGAAMETISINGENGFVTLYAPEERMEVFPTGINAGQNPYNRGYVINMDTTGGPLMEMYSGGGQTININGDAGSGYFGGDVTIDGNLVVNGNYPGGGGGSAASAREYILTESDTVVRDQNNQPVGFHYDITYNEPSEPTGPYYRGIQADVFGLGRKFGVRGNVFSGVGDAAPKTGLFGSATGPGTGDHTGIYGQAFGDGDNNIAMRAVAGTADSTNGVDPGQFDPSGTYNTGLSALAFGNLHGNTGVFGQATGGTGYDNIGVVGWSEVDNGEENKGILGWAKGPGVNKGVVGLASDGSDNWAGWFEGNTRIIDGNLRIGDDSQYTDVSSSGVFLRGSDGEVNGYLGSNFLDGGAEGANRGSLVLWGDTATRSDLNGQDIRRVELRVSDDGTGKDIGALSLRGPWEGDNSMVELGGYIDQGEYVANLVLRGSDGNSTSITSNGIGNVPEFTVGFPFDSAGVFNGGDQGIYLNADGGGGRFNNVHTNDLQIGQDFFGTNNGSYIDQNGFANFSANVETGSLGINTTPGEYKGISIRNSADSSYNVISAFEENDGGIIDLANDQGNVSISLQGGVGDARFDRLVDIGEEIRIGDYFNGEGIQIRADTANDFVNIDVRGGGIQMDGGFGANEIQLGDPFNADGIWLQSNGNGEFTGSVSAKQEMTIGSPFDSAGVFNGGDQGVYINGNGGGVRVGSVHTNDLQIGQDFFGTGNGGFIDGNGFASFSGNVETQGVILYNDLSVKNSGDSSYNVISAFEESNYGIIDFYANDTTVNISLQGGSGDGNFTGQVSADVLQSTSGTVQSSDERLKKNIQTIDGALANTMKMRGVSYQWKDQAKSQQNQIGVIAQEVEAVYPEFVHTNKDGIKSVNYAQMTAVLIEALKELNEEVKELKKENKQLQTKVEQSAELESRLSKLEKILGVAAGETSSANNN